jgi:hypothetical protein
MAKECRVRRKEDKVTHRIKYPRSEFLRSITIVCVKTKKIKYADPTQSKIYVRRKTKFMATSKIINVTKAAMMLMSV